MVGPYSAPCLWKLQRQTLNRITWSAISCNRAPSSSRVKYLDPAPGAVHLRWFSRGDDEYVDIRGYVIVGFYKTSQL